MRTTGRRKTTRGSRVTRRLGGFASKKRGVRGRAIKRVGSQGSEDEGRGSAVVSRMVRLVQLVRMVEGAGLGTKATELADQLGVSRRTVFRDLKTLNDAGVDSRRRTVSTGNGRSSGAGLDSSEVIGLILVGKLVKQMEGQPMFRDAMRGIEKVIESLPAAQRRVLREMMSRVSVRPGAINVTGQDEEYYRTLQVCIDERKTCHVLYDGVEPYGRISTRIHPLHLHFHNRAWYVMAYCETKEEVRTFKLSRFMELEPLRQHFAPMKFSVEAYLDDAWGLIPGERKYDVALKFSAKVARNVSEVKWHRTQNVEWGADGGCVLRFRVRGLEEIRWWVMGYGSECEVLDPAELRAEVGKIARAMVKREERRGGR